MLSRLHCSPSSSCLPASGTCLLSGMGRLASMSQAAGVNTQQPAQDEDMYTSLHALQARP